MKRQAIAILTALLVLSWVAAPAQASGRQVSPKTRAFAELNIDKATCTLNEGSSYDIGLSLELRISSIKDGCSVSVVDVREGQTNLLVPFISYFYSLDQATVGDGAAWTREPGNTPRMFGFVTTVEDLHTITAELKAAQRFEDMPPGEPEKIARLYHNLAGTLKMSLTSRYSEGSGPAKMVFKIEGKMPAPPQPDDSFKRAESLHDVELSDSFVAEILGFTPVKCMSQYVLDIGQPVFHDFDGDGNDEAVIYGYSCWSGVSGGPNELDVLTIQDGMIQNVPFQRPPRKGPPGYYNGLMGHRQFEIAGDSLVELYPVYNKGDASCCPSGGERRFFYLMKNGEFVLDKVTDSAQGAIKTSDQERSETSPSSGYTASETYDDEIDKADKLHDAGKLQEAHTLYLKTERLAKTDEQKVRVYGSLSVTFYEQENYRKAKEYCNKLLSLSPKSRWAQKWLKKIEQNMH